MQEGTPTRGQLQQHLASLGLDADGATLDALLPVYTGLLSGGKRIASLDLGEREPSMTFRHPRPQERV